MELNDIQRLAPTLYEIAGKYRIREIFVFGSIARGEINKANDVDFLIELEEGASALGVGGFQHEAQKLLGVRVDVVPTFALHRAHDRAFVDSILSEAIPL
jgi:predicted nucleotidyltransferase